MDLHVIVVKDSVTPERELFLLEDPANLNSDRAGIIGVVNVLGRKCRNAYVCGGDIVIAKIAVVRTAMGTGVEVPPGFAFQFVSAG
jgi:hypothetical protein